MIENRPTDLLVAGAKSALLHFGKAAVEVVSGFAVLVESVTRIVRPGDEGWEDESGGPQKIEIE